MGGRGWRGCGEGAGGHRVKVLNMHLRHGWLGIHRIIFSRASCWNRRGVVEEESGGCRSGSQGGERA